MSARGMVGALALALTLWGPSGSAQSLTGTPLPPSPYPDARLVPRGALRLSLEPQYVSFGDVYDANGTRQPLGAPFSSDSAGADLFATAGDAQRAAQRIAGLAAYRLSIGQLTTTLEADIRRVPLNAQFGLTKALTLTASVPLVTTRTQVHLALDTSAANAGWNLATEASGQAAVARPQIATLLAQLEAGAQFIEGQMAAGAYGCPTSATCGEARAAVDRARGLAMDIVALTGVDASGATTGALPPFAPRASSAAGMAIASALAAVSADFQTFGATPVAGVVPLPSSYLDTGAVQHVLSDAEFGYEATLGFVKRRQQLGDVELGARWGLVQAEHLRAVILGTVRLPTGKRDAPDHLVDYGTGDRQTDVIGGFEAVWTPGSVLALAVTGAYTAQFGDRLERRVTDPEHPIALAASLETADRNLGDLVQLSAYPSLRLSDTFTAYGAVHYFRKGADRYSPPPGLMDGVDFSLLERQTAFRQVSLGGGVHYAAEGSERHLPIQAGIDYRAAFRGSGGRAPMDVRLHLYLRLYYRLF